MPTLKQLTCHVEWANSRVPFQEYGTSYEDGVVKCIVAVPTVATPFCISLKSSGYIAPGLAMFVFIDGVYQCNRNRNNLSQSEKYGEDGKRRRDVTFRVRQKEERLPDGSWVGRPWRFEPLQLVPNPPEGPNIPEEHFKHLGTIQVVILRCAFRHHKDSDGDELSDGVLTPQSYMAPGYSPDDVDPISDDESIHEVAPRKLTTGFFGLDECLGAMFDGPHDGRRAKNHQNDNRDHHHHCPNCRNDQVNQRYPQDSHTGCHDGYCYTPVMDNRRQQRSMPHLVDDIHHCRHHNCTGTAMAAPNGIGTSYSQHSCRDRFFKSDTSCCSCQHSSSSTPCSYDSCSLHRNGHLNGVRLSNGNKPPVSFQYGDRGDTADTSRGNGPSVVLNINAPYNPDPQTYLDPPFVKGSNRKNSDSGCYKIENGQKVHQKEGWGQNAGDKGWMQQGSENRSNKKNGDDWETAANERNNSGTNTWESYGGNDSGGNQGATDAWGASNDQDNNSDRGQDDNWRKQQGDSSWGTWGEGNRNQTDDNQQHNAEDSFGSGRAPNTGGGSNNNQGNSSWGNWDEDNNNNQTDTNNINTGTSWNGHGNNNTNWASSNGDGQQANGHHLHSNYALGPGHPFVSPGSRDQAIDEPPLYTVPEGLAKARCLSHQVQPGARATYCHNIRTPKYIDNIEKPYAKFIFEYRRREVIQDKLKVEVKRDLDEERKILESLPRAEIVKRLLEAQGLLGQKTQSGWKNPAQANGTSSQTNGNSTDTWSSNPETQSWNNAARSPKNDQWGSSGGDQGGGNGGSTSPAQNANDWNSGDPFAEKLTGKLQNVASSQDNNNQTWNSEGDQNYGNNDNQW